MNEVVVARVEKAPTHSRVAMYVWVGLAALSLLIVAMIVAAPLAAWRADARLSSFIYATFSYVCHQLPERSFHFAGHKLGVCSRCTGIYAGFAFSVLLYPLARPLHTTQAPSRIWLILAALPLAVDFGLGYFNIWSNTHASRFITGALFSSVTVLYIMPGLVDLGSAIARRFSSRASQALRNAGESG